MTKILGSPRPRPLQLYNFEIFIITKRWSQPVSDVDQSVSHDTESSTLHTDTNPFNLLIIPFDHTETKQGTSSHPIVPISRPTPFE